jgi:hypothetical protein
MATVSLACNENVEPASFTARALWADERCREELMRSWSGRVDMSVVFSDPISVDACVAARFRDADEGWVMAWVTLDRLECSERHAARYGTVAAADMFRLTGVRAFDLLSRNPTLRPCDIEAHPAASWDIQALASNGSVPVDFLIERLGESPNGAYFFEALSRHPRLEWRHVLSNVSAPWNAFAITANPAVTTHAALSTSAFPFVSSALVLNPNFQHCQEHGYACQYTRASLRPPFETCGMISASTARCAGDVNWEVYLRHTGAPSDALQAAIDSGNFSIGTLHGAMANKFLSLGQAAWLGAVAYAYYGDSVACELLRNPLRVARAEFECRLESARILYARLAAMVCAHIRLPVHIRKQIARAAVCIALDDAYRVADRNGVNALVEFKCGLRESSAAVWVPYAMVTAQPNCLAAGRPHGLTALAKIKI